MLFHRILSLATLVLLVQLPASLLAASFTPPRNLDPASAGIILDSTFQQDAWLVYTHDIDVDGKVVNAQIRSSNGVPGVEAAVLEKLNRMRFEPATRDGRPVRFSADPVIFTWILDLPRQMSPQFEETYQAAWALFGEANYDAAFDQAARLRNTPGRNAFEETRFQILAASLASRWQDGAAELRHLERVVELESLARDNNFKNHYVEPDQYLLILERVQSLQLERMMLADAGVTLARIRAGGDTEVARRAAAAYAEAERAFRAQPDVRVSGELVAIYRDGPGAWKTGLSRQKFAVGDVSGKIDAVFLACDNEDILLPYPSGEPWSAPAGASQCKIDITGSPGTRFVLHQYAR